MPHVKARSKAGRKLTPTPIQAPATEPAPSTPAPMPVQSAKTGTKVKPALQAIGGSMVENFNVKIINQVFPTVWCIGKDQDSQSATSQAVMAAMVAFKPADEIEGMLAAQAVSMHFGAMECFRRAMMKDQPADIANKLRRDGANLARGMTDMLEALDRKRGKGPQVVRVERVVVNEGGQAIVGNVARNNAQGG